MSFRAGDHIHHGPTGEQWVLACDEENGEVICCGWPETVAAAADCSLIEAATDEERIKTLQNVAKVRGDSGGFQMRALRAQRQIGVQP